jgi:hypothetical protein
VLGTIFFDSITRGDFHNALSRTLLVQIAMMAGLLLLSPLLPRFAREPLPGDVHTAEALAPV